MGLFHASFITFVIEQLKPLHVIERWVPTVFLPWNIRTVFQLYSAHTHIYIYIYIYISLYAAAWHILEYYTQVRKWITHSSFERFELFFSERLSQTWFYTSVYPCNAEYMLHIHAAARDQIYQSTTNWFIEHNSFVIVSIFFHTSCLA